MRSRTWRIAAVAGVCALVSSGASADRHRPAPQDWHDAKCTRYKAAWSQALARTGTGGLSREFLDRHEAYLVSNCTIRSDVCPRSEEELRLANVMVVLSMNFGAASTFAPFYCR